jgi:hypothetical protein
MPSGATTTSAVSTTSGSMTSTSTALGILTGAGTKLTPPGEPTVRAYQPRAGWSGSSARRLA